MSTEYDVDVAGVLGVSHDCQFHPAQPGAVYPGPKPGTPGPYHDNGEAAKPELRFTGLLNAMLIAILSLMIAK